MEQFENVETYFSYEYEDSDGYMQTSWNGGDGYYVAEMDYDRLLNAYKELKHRMEGLEK